MNFTKTQMISLILLLIYFAGLLFAVTREKKNKGTTDYFFGDRKLPFWTLSITFIASWWGAGSALSTADLAFDDGIGAFWYYGVPVLISTLLMIIMAKGIRRVGYLTQGQMMKARYSEGVSKMLSVMILIFMTFTAASQMVGIGDFFGTYLGFNYEVAVIVGTLIVLIYSLFGGFRAVVLTDIIQFVLLIFSALVVFAVAFYYSGGIDQIKIAALAQNKINFFNIESGASKYMVYVITFGCAWMIQANVWQRISAARSDTDAKKMTIMSFFAFIPLYLIVVLTGMAGISLYDKLPSGGIVTAIVMDYMNPVIGALVFVGITAAIMSTMDSLINTGAMTLTLDLRKKGIEDNEKLKFSKIATLLVTVVALIIALGVRSILTVSWMASDIITTGIFVPLTFGFFFRRGNSKGALSSMITGFIYCMYNLLIFVGVNLPHFWVEQSALQVIVGVTISSIVYFVVSFATKPEYEKADAFINLAEDKKNKLKAS